MTPECKYNSIYFHMENVNNSSPFWIPGKPLNHGKYCSEIVYHQMAE